MKSFLLLISYGGIVFAAGQIHSVKMKPDQILLVKTALGIATIIEAPDAVQSAVIGDQSGFRIEYLDRAVTIKPLRAYAKTNLYLQTPTRRYDLRLETGRQETADYVVYLKSEESVARTIWHDVNKSASDDDISLRCLRVGQVSDGIILLDCRFYSKTKVGLKPEDIWIYQGKDSKVINGLFLSRLDVTKGSPVTFGLTLLKSDLTKDKPIEVKFKTARESLALKIPAEVLWR